MECLQFENKTQITLVLQKKNSFGKVKKDISSIYYHSGYLRISAIFFCKTNKQK